MRSCVFFPFLLDLRSGDPDVSSWLCAGWDKLFSTGFVCCGVSVFISGGIGIGVALENVSFELIYIVCSHWLSLRISGGMG